METLQDELQEANARAAEFKAAWLHEQKKVSMCMEILGVIGNVYDDLEGDEQMPIELMTAMGQAADLITKIQKMDQEAWTQQTTTSPS